jgi:ribosomal-protein-alanine N-acetyltransferase
MPFPRELTTERLRLRPPRETDAERIYSRYGHDERVCRYMSWTPHRSVDDTIAYLRRILAENEAGTSASYLIFAADSGELLGSVGGKIETTFVQFGYCLAPDTWGRGYAPEAARAFVAAALAEPTVWRVQAFCDVENRASARVLEKCGLTYEGTLRRYLVMPNLSRQPRDMRCYAKVREKGAAATD